MVQDKIQFQMLSLMLSVIKASKSARSLGVLGCLSRKLLLLKVVLMMNSVKNLIKSSWEETMNS